MNFNILILRISGTIFGIVALLHLLRLFTKVPVVIGCWSMPLWVNYFGFIGAAFLCGFLWKISSKKHNDNTK